MMVSSLRSMFIVTTTINDGKGCVGDGKVTTTKLQSL